MFTCFTLVVEQKERFSMLTVNEISAENKVSFRGWSRTEKGTPYYKTQKGAIAGGIMAVPAFLSFALKDKGLDFNKKHGVDPKTIKILEEQAANIGKNDKLYGAIAGVMTLGCGLIVDYFRNKKAADAADYTKKVGIKNALRYGDRISISDNQRTYYESNIGSKYGWLLGAACGIANTIMRNGSGKNLPKGFYFVSTIVNVAAYSLGGWIMGKITDSLTNSSAEKNS